MNRPFRPRRLLPAAVVAVALLGAACGSGGAAETAGEDAGLYDDVVHVHDLLIREDDTILAATHLGLYRVTGDGLEPVGSAGHDLMAAVLDGDTILASGHPDLRDDDLRVEDLPPLLGIVQSTDGETWSPRSLLGEADFHRLVFADDQLFAANSSDEALWVSGDAGTTWEARAGEAQLVAMAVNPADSTEVIGVDLDRGLVRSDDGGDTWTPMDGPELSDLEWTKDGIIGHDNAGAVHRFDDETWSRVDALRDVAALGTRGDELFALRLPSTVLRSIDGGTTWKDFP